MEFYHFTLPNGIRVIHQPTNGEVSHCGLTIAAGSRDELENEQGLAHFIEHAIFKGTKKRKAFHILSRLDAVGGEINAYTSKEETNIYASFQNAHYERAIELLSDITFNSTFPARELNKEKDVIIDEINSYLDSPSEQIFDDFEDLIFKGHPLGRNVLGTIESVSGFNKKNVQQFMQRSYTTDRIVFSSVGNISEKKLRRLVENCFGHIKATTNTSKRSIFKANGAVQKSITRDTHQTHSLIGNTAYKASDDKRRGLILLNNILGGPALNTRLGLEIREKYGYAYYIESNYTPYSDTGLINIYFGTEAKHYDKTRKLIYKELKKLREKKLGVRQLHQAKQQLKGHIALAQESRSNLMFSLGKSLLLYNKVDSIQDVYNSIDAISESEILEIANEIFNENHLSELTYSSK
jgi:predicted Zn-dependent peptidase